MPMTTFASAVSALLLVLGIGYFFGQKSPVTSAEKPDAGIAADAGQSDAGPPPLCLMMACQWKQSDAGITASVDCPKGFSAKRLEIANVLGCACCAEGGGK